MTPALLQATCLKPALLQCRIDSAGFGKCDFLSVDGARKYSGLLDRGEWSMVQVSGLIRLHLLCFGLEFVLKYKSHGVSLFFDRWFPFLGSKACCEACANLKAAFLVAVVSVFYEIVT